MEEEYVELIPEGLTRGVSLQGAYFLMLREKGGKRFLPSLLEKDEYYQVFLALHEQKFPRTHLMSRLAHRFSIELEAVHIFYPPHGNLSCILFFKQEDKEEKMPCNIAEGITIALENQCPIMMQRQVFEKQMLRQNGEGQVSMPIYAMNKQLLQEALQAAVAEENFELASVIRDEIKQRETFNGAETPKE